MMGSLSLGDWGLLLLLSFNINLCYIEVLQQPGTAVHTCHFSTQEAEAKDCWKFQVSQGDIVGHSL